MKAIICGCGDVGSNIASYLFEENHQVVVIDSDKEKLQKMESMMDIQTVLGPASSPEVLEQAGAKDADLIIAVTQSDEVNMIVCFEAARLFNVPLKIARVRSGFYAHQSYAPLWEEMHIDVVISPEKEVARTILRNLKTPGALEFIVLEDKTVFVGAKCVAGCAFEKARVATIDKKFPAFRICIAGIVRDSHRVEIDDKTTILAGDEVYAITDIEHYEDVLDALGHPSKKEDRVMIVGGGRVGFSLAKLMEVEGMAAHLSLVEANEGRALYLAKHLPDTLVIKGDAMDESILDEAGIEKTDAVVSLTGEDEDNILLSLLTKQYGVKRTFALINKSIYNHMLAHLGVDVIVNPNAIATSTILRHIRKGQVQSIYSLKPEVGDLMSFEALETSKIIGVPLAKIKKPAGVRICGVVRDGALLELKPDLEIQSGDSVIILAKPGLFKEVEKLFSAGLFFF